MYFIEGQTKYSCLLRLLGCNCIFDGHFFVAWVKPSNKLQKTMETFLKQLYGIVYRRLFGQLSDGPVLSFTKSLFKQTSVFDGPGNTSFLPPSIVNSYIAHRTLSNKANAENDGHERKAIEIAIFVSPSSSSNFVAICVRLICMIFLTNICNNSLISTHFFLT